jgi:cation diffusion facilitator family transporter
LRAHEHPLEAKSQRAQRAAIKLSLAVGFLMLAIKTSAFWITGSAAILSDALESVVHVAAVGFAAWSVILSQRPPDRNHPYGHEKVSFFSAGVEGALIGVAALAIIFEAVAKWLGGLRVERLGLGAAMVALAGAINAALGVWLVWQGKRHGSLILEANGRHVLTDSWTSLGVVVGLVAAIVTGWLPFDPIVAILVALNILVSGYRLMRRSVGGLMDEGDPKTEAAVAAALERTANPLGIKWHGLRHRESGRTTWVELHLLFPRGTPIEVAHARATEIERAIADGLETPADVLTHLESAEDHPEDHGSYHARREAPEGGR